MISTRSVELVIDTVVCLTLAKWDTVSGQFGGYLKTDLYDIATSPIGSCPEPLATNRRRRDAQPVNLAANPTQIVRHDPFRSLAGRMSVGVQSNPTELSATQTAARPWVRAGVASSLNYLPDRRQR